MAGLTLGVELPPVYTTDRDALRELRQTLTAHLSDYPLPYYFGWGFSRKMRERNRTLYALLQKIESQLAAPDVTGQKLAALSRTVSDKQYMIDYLVDVLGPNAKKLWKSIQERNVTRTHVSWGPKAASLTGEQRAKMLLNILEQASKPNHGVIIAGAGAPKTKKKPKHVSEYLK